MAVAKLVCGACGAEIEATDTKCASCGATIEQAPARDSATVEHAQSPSAERRCDVCGHVNANAGDYCQSCGARLGEGSAAPPQSKPAKQQKPQQKTQQKQAKKSNGPKKKLEPWTIITIAAILVLAAFFAYMELSKPGAQSSSSSAGSTTAGPAPMMPQQPMPDLRPLQAAFDANPRDPAAILRLANGLHDNGLFQRAIDMYQKYLGISPRDPDARVDMGICYYQRALADSVNASSLFNTAVKEMSTAIGYKPDHQPAAFNLGIVNLHMGNLEESNKWLQKAVAINKGSDLGIRAQQILDQHLKSK